MKILIKAKPGARSSRIEHAAAANDSSHRGLPCFKVSVTARAIDGKANESVLRIIAEHFKIPITNVRIVSGHTASQKIVEILERG